MSIYVEILIRAPMDVLWTHTQTPVFHEKWDLRFSRIDYQLAFAVVLLFAWHRRWPGYVCLGSMLLATAAVGLNSPRYFEAAFNPASLNLTVACLAAIDPLVLGGLPTAARCLRRPRPEKA